jgi:hypothetical protein
MAYFCIGFFGVVPSTEMIHRLAASCGEGVPSRIKDRATGASAVHGKGDQLKRESSVINGSRW